jgi:uncharacterized membrane protein YecN with MAPEG domain
LSTVPADSLSAAFAATVTALVVVYIWLSARVIRLRRAHRVGVGDGDVPALRLAIRVHANFAEYVPLALVALGTADLRGAPEPLVAVLGAVLVLARVSHAEGLSRTAGSTPFRTAGVAGTAAVLVFSCLAALLA